MVEFNFLVVILIGLSFSFEVTEGLTCNPNEYCCGTLDVNILGMDECSQCCNTGLAFGAILALALGIPVALIVGCVLCCCLCPGCPLNRQPVNRDQIVLVQGQNPGYYPTQTGPGLAPDAHVHVLNQSSGFFPQGSGPYLTPPLKGPHLPAH